MKRDMLQSLSHKEIIINELHLSDLKINKYEQMKTRFQENNHLKNKMMSKKLTLFRNATSKFVALGFSLLIMCTAAFSQNSEIKGIVKEKSTGEPMYNVNVYVEVGGVPYGTSTDTNGKYTIKPLNSGVYTVRAKSLGYDDIVTTNVKLTSDKITYVDIDMVEASYALDGVVIVAEREVIHEIPLINKDEPHVQTLTPKELSNSVNQKDPIKMATMLPGVTLANNGKDVYIRGARPTSTQFITDGMKSITGEIGIPGLAIGAMKVYTGGVPAKYGDVNGGVIVVETKSYFDLSKEYK